MRKSRNLKQLKNRISEQRRYKENQLENLELKNRISVIIIIIIIIPDLIICTEVWKRKQHQ
jgi:hypothetical protein